MKKLIITIILFAAVCVYAQTDDKTTLKTLNQNLVESYKNNKLDDALKFANQAVELSLKIFGAENAETATAYTNLGVILREKQKYKDSIANLQKVVEISEKLPKLKAKILVEAYETLAFSQFLGGKNTESLANYLRAFEIADTKIGKDSKEGLSCALNAASGYAREKNYEKANEFYLKSYRLAWKNYGKDAKEIEQISDSRTCVLQPSINSKKDLEKKFSEATAKLFTEIFGDEPKTEKSETSINGGVINGKAISLPKPEYPQEVRNKRLQGTISIRVLIDEQGNIIEAKSMCGKGYLETASEEAAKKAKFSPTYLSGKAVKVSGIIVYRFVAQ
jgi:TonB family protein